MARLSTQNGVFHLKMDTKGGTELKQNWFFGGHEARKTDNDSTTRFSGLNTGVEHALKSPTKTGRAYPDRRMPQVCGAPKTLDRKIQGNNKCIPKLSKTDPCPLFFKSFFSFCYFSHSFDLPPTSSCDGVTSTGYTVISPHNKAPEDVGKDAARMRS